MNRKVNKTYRVEIFIHLHTPLCRHNWSTEPENQKEHEMNKNQNDSYKDDSIV